MRSAGFTLVELIVTLGVAAILLGLAAPAFDNFFAQRAMTANINEMVVAINYARSEAARLGQPVSLQAEDPTDDNEWGRGYCVVLGTPGNCDDPIRTFAPLFGRELNAVNGPDGNLNGVETLTFDARGLLASGQGGAMELCSDDGSNPGRVLRLNLIGRTTTADLECEG